MAKGEHSPLAGKERSPRHGQPPHWIVATVIGYLVASLAGFALLAWVAPNAIGESDDAAYRHLFLFTSGMMIACGVIGGALYDVRGLIKHSSRDDFDPRYALSYVLRPLAGGLSALIAFFLLLVGALGFSASHDAVEGGGWLTFEGRLPYLAVAFLAGYASQVFMLKLKDIADTVFAPRSEREDEPPSVTPPEADEVPNERREAA